MSLKFNTYRTNRYLRSKFVEGKYLLASEATDLELELLDVLRRTVQKTFGDSVALEDAWKVEKLSTTELLVKPGQAFFKGLPFDMRSGKDQLVSGAILTAGTVPVGVTIDDDATGLGKIITLNDGGTTPTNLYKILITAKEELITEVEDPFLQNANLTEATAQKIRLVYQINIVPDSLQTESPEPYRDENSTSLSVTDFPSTGGFASPNFVNQIVVTPTASGNGELISTTLISGSEKIDGRDLELVLTNDSGIGGGHPIPKSPTEQAAFANGRLIDSYGNKFHINSIFNDVISTQVVIRIDKEPDQPNPQIVNTLPFTLVKREVFATDSANGLPQGKLHYEIAKLDWDETDGILHESSVTDLRVRSLNSTDYEIFVNNKEGLRLTSGGTLSWTQSTSLLSWGSALELVNPHGPNLTIAAATIPVMEDGSLAYDLDLANGGAIEKGTLSISVTSFGATSNLAAVNLSQVKIGNVVKDSAGVVAEITAIDDVNNTITTSPSLTANGAGTIYYDSFGPGKAPLSEKTYILAVRNGNKIYLGYDDTGLSDGETGSVGQGISNQTLVFIGATSETDSSPNYSSNFYILDGDSLVTASGKLDAAIDALTSAVATSLSNLRTFVGSDGDSDTTPDYSSNIRGTANESLEARAGALTSDIGDEQEDRSAYFRSDNEVTWTGTDLQFSSDIVLEVVNTKSGTVKTATILSAGSPISLADGESAYISISRTTASENVSVVLSGTTPIPAQSEANKDVIVLARRQDVLGVGYLHIPFHKQLMEPGQSSRLGASGSGGGASVSVTAGENLSARDAVYISKGNAQGDTGRTTGRAYKLDASNDHRMEFVGFVKQTVLSGATVSIQGGGEMSGFATLDPGIPLWADYTTPGAYTQTAPTTAQNWLIPLGIASTADKALINPAGGATAVFLEAALASFSVANNTADQMISGLVLDGTTHRSMQVNFSLRRATDSNEVVQTGWIRVWYNTLTTTYDIATNYSGDDVGATFTVDSGGQVKVTTDSLAGSSYVGEMRYSVERFEVGV